MSNHFAIATVTESLRRYIQAALDQRFSGAFATALRPGATDASFSPTDTRANLYLYQVVPNAQLRNNDLPTRRPDGSLSQRPSLALDLHYLVSFFGDTDLTLQRAMGAVLVALHAGPLLSPTWISGTIALTATLAGSDLDQQPERIRLTPLGLGLEEMSKLWSVLFQTPYALSVAFTASVVLLEPEVVALPSLPVRSRGVYVETLSIPRVDTVERLRATQLETEALRDGDRVRVRGARLSGSGVEVHLGAATLVPTEVHEGEILFDLTLTPTLRSGMQTLQIVTPLPPHGSPGVSSNGLAVAVHPRITSLVATSTVATATVAVTVGPRQQVYLVLNGDTTFGTTGGAALRRPMRLVDTTSLTWDVTDLPSGRYYARVIVDGAESLLEPTDVPAPGVVPGRYTGPLVEIPP